MQLNLDDLREMTPEDERAATAAAMRHLNEIAGAQQAEMNMVFAATQAADGMRLRANAGARRAAIDVRDLAIQQNELLKQLVEKNRADAQRWKDVAIALFTGLIVTIMGWLLSALNAAQLLTHLFHR